jgi:CheY-like chemotaxis protein
MRSILQVGNDLALRDVRAAVLRLVGATVSTATTDEAIYLLQRRQFDLIVFCHTVPRREKEEISAVAREAYANIRVLYVLSPSRMNPAANESVAEPKQLLAKVMEILDTPAAEQQESC